MQGREKDITIFSTVRSRERGPIGFVRDERRINVGLTRARMSLIVIGNAASLQSDPRWTNLVQHCLRNGCAQTFVGSRSPACNFHCVIATRRAWSIG